MDAVVKTKIDQQEEEIRKLKELFNINLTKQSISNDIKEITKPIENNEKPIKKRKIENNDNNNDKKKKKPSPIFNSGLRFFIILCLSGLFHFGDDKYTKIENTFYDKAEIFIKSIKEISDSYEELMKEKKESITWTGITRPDQYMDGRIQILLKEYYLNHKDNSDNTIIFKISKGYYDWEIMNASKSIEERTEIALETKLFKPKELNASIVKLLMDEYRKYYHNFIKAYGSLLKDKCTIYSLND